VNKGTLRTFKASDDEKFQISSDHFNQFCTPPHLDEKKLGLSKYQPLNSGLDFHYPHYHSWTLTGYEPKLKSLATSKITPHQDVGFP
jgi:hypothetical protein